MARRTFHADAVPTADAAAAEKSFDPPHLVADRRAFLARALAAGVGAAGFAGRTFAAEPVRKRSANDKLNVAVIGVANRGGANLAGVAHENIVALCDVDSRNLGRAAEAHKKSNPKLRTFADFRKLFDEVKDIDAVVVSTPDHTHFHPAMAALERGLPVYCEKPLAHSVWEARKLREKATEKKLVTQMGTQIHAGDNYRRVVELVQSGQLGNVTRVHVWLAGGMRVFKEAPVTKPPVEVDYDLWTGPAPLRPFSEAHFHFNWRYWWDYGNGALGDFGCHYMDLPFWALELGHPTKVRAQGEKGHDGLNECPLDLQVDYEFPARGDLPAVHLTWYQGKRLPEEFAKFGDGKRSGVLFEGTGGRLVADYGTHRIFAEPGSDFTPLKPVIPPSIGHHREFLQAVRGEGKTTCPFEYSGVLSEAVLLGNVAYRAGNQELLWDAPSLRATNLPDANQFLRRAYRKGWEVS